MPFPAYDLLFFDADETLFDYKKSEETAFYLTLDEFVVVDIGLKHAVYQSYQVINKGLWVQYQTGQIDKETLLRVRFELLQEKWPIEFDACQFSHRYLEHLANQSHLLHDAVRVIAELSKHCRMAIITNGVSTVQHPRLKQSALAGYFPIMVVSDDQPQNPKFHKPNTAIFEHTFAACGGGVPREKILMVGDSLVADIAGGINYGIDTCWFNEYGAVNESPFAPTFEISNLNALLALVLR